MIQITCYGKASTVKLQDRNCHQFIKADKDGSNKYICSEPSASTLMEAARAHMHYCLSRPGRIEASLFGSIMSVSESGIPPEKAYACHDERAIGQQRQVIKIKNMVQCNRATCIKASGLDLNFGRQPPFG